MDLILMAGTVAAILILGLVAWCVWQLIADKRFERENQPALIVERERKRRIESAGADEGAMDVSELTGLARTLALAGINQTPGTFIIIVCAAAIGAAAAGLAVGGVAGAFIGVIACPIAAKLILNRKERKRTELFEKQLTNAEMQIAENLRSGLSVARSLRTVSEQTKDPLKKQFEAVYNEITYSSTTLPQALSNMAARTANKDVELLATVIKVQDETGSDLSDSLEFLSDTLSKRTEMRNSVKVALSEIKTTIKIVACMPAAALAVTCAFYNGYSEFYQSTPGLIMLAVCAVIELIALAILGRMSNIKLD